MPKYTLPKIKKEKKNRLSAGCSIENDYYRRRITLPANQAILDALAIDDEVTIVLKGKVTELDKHESPDNKRLNFGIEFDSVETRVGTKASNEKAFSDGYKKATQQKE